MSGGRIPRVRWAVPVAVVLLAVSLTGCGRLGANGGENTPAAPATPPAATAPATDGSLDSVGADLDAADGAARQADSDGAAGDANASTDDAP